MGTFTISNLHLFYKFNLYHFYDRRAGEGRFRMVVGRVLTKQSDDDARPTCLPHLPDSLAWSPFTIPSNERLCSDS